MIAPHSILHRLRAWFPLLPLSLLLAGTYWLNQQVQPFADKNANKPHVPDVIVDHLSATQLNKAGTPHFILSSEKVQHYPDDDSTHLTKPYLDTLAPNQPTIHSTASTGEISSKGNEVFLRGDVRVVRAASAKQSAMTFTTDYLHVVPNAHTMDTDRPITLTDALNNVQAVGMKYDNKTRIITLLSQVRSRHEIANAKP
ncbi:MAG: LPS export ABC transporter periplasmic protein LptC [Gallionellaceae bacterium]|jgi:lipopolysaccharide export system protein LptC|nr:LPS export ABC transporter periplasmic protein LptC [Gallionellaceae bacterium]